MPMKNMYSFTLFIVTILAHSHCFSQEKILYKQVDTTKLFIEVYHPDKMDATQKYPAIVFFFGGGWNEGTYKQFEPHAKYFSQRGMVCFLVDYRVKNRHKTTPFESLKDAKSAMRYVRENSEKFHIDPSKIIASGGSAGGHLAAATSLIKSYDESTDNLNISCKANALVLFNPVLDNGPEGYGYSRIGEAYKNFSPKHNLENGAPPTIIFLGTNDNLIPVETIKNYESLMNKTNSRCDVHLYEGRTHGFFNYNKFEDYKNTVLKADNFLQSLGYLKKEPIIDIVK
jgi:acetyl esterase/lipase